MCNPIGMTSCASVSGLAPHLLQTREVGIHRLVKAPVAQGPVAQGPVALAAATQAAGGGPHQEISSARWRGSLLLTRRSRCMSSTPWLPLWWAGQVKHLALSVPNDAEKC